jgi:hypothetical protein
MAYTVYHTVVDVKNLNRRGAGSALTGLLGLSGKLLGELEGVHGLLVRLLAEFVRGEVISLAVGHGCGGVGVGRKVVVLRGSIMRALWHAVLLARLLFWYVRCGRR